MILAHWTGSDMLPKPVGVLCLNTILAGEPLGTIAHNVAIEKVDTWGRKNIVLDTNDIKKF